MPEERDLIRRGLDVAHAVAQRIASRFGGAVCLDDLMGIGHVALLEIARSYDPAQSSFDGYAAVKLKWAMLDGVRRETHLRSAGARMVAVIGSERFGDGREPERDEPRTIEDDQAALRAYLDGKAAAMALGLLGGPPDPELRTPEAETPEERFARAEALHAAREAVRALPDDRQRALVERHYFEGEPFDAIARDLGITKSWASRLHDRALAALHETMKSAA